MFVQKEVDNPHDKNAIALFVSKPEEEKIKLGYIARNHTRHLKEYLDKDLVFEINTLFPASIKLDVSLK